MCRVVGPFFALTTARPRNPGECDACSVTAAAGHGARRRKGWCDERTMHVSMRVTTHRGLEQTAVRSNDVRHMSRRLPEAESPHWPREPSLSSGILSTRKRNTSVLGVRLRTARLDTLNCVSTMPRWTNVQWARCTGYIVDTCAENKPSAGSVALQHYPNAQMTQLAACNQTLWTCHPRTSTRGPTCHDARHNMCKQCKHDTQG